LLIAGTQSGCGKTTITLALMQAARRQGLRCAPFKAGPDFLDPFWHTAICDRSSYNLDTRMMSEQACRDLFTQQQHASDISIIEGVMGLFDGASGVGGAGSSAHLAAVLQQDVYLVVSAKGMSGSIVPLVEGFTRQAASMGVTIAGVIANHVGSAHHAALLRDLLIEYQQPPLLAWMEKNAPTLAERHLGLCQPGEQELPDFGASFHIESPALFNQQPLDHATNPLPTTVPNTGKTLAIARDAALCFIYTANIEWLQAQGVKLLYFSPLAGEPVPAEADALWLPGGYPELHADTLAHSATWASLRAVIATGLPVLAECGGMMILGERLYRNADDSVGVPMANVLPCNFVMQEKLASLGYREEASGVRGHEFHHSRRIWQSNETIATAFNVTRGDGGVHHHNLRASYIHWYFPSAPEVIRSWLQLV